MRATYSFSVRVNLKFDVETEEDKIPKSAVAKASAGVLADIAESLEFGREVADDLADDYETPIIEPHRAKATVMRK